VYVSGQPTFGSSVLTSNEDTPPLTVRAVTTRGLTIVNAPDTVSALPPSKRAQAVTVRDESYSPSWSAGLAETSESNPFPPESPGSTSTEPSQDDTVVAWNELPSEASVCPVATGLQKMISRLSTEGSRLPALLFVTPMLTPPPTGRAVPLAG
jgi:hypothetical protein